MALEIEWTAEAERQLDQIIEYLAIRWTQKETEIFFQKLEKGIEIISRNPKQQKQSLRKENTYEYQLSKQTTIFYDFDTTKATILLLWQNAMNPENL